MQTGHCVSFVHRIRITQDSDAPLLRKTDEGFATMVMDDQEIVAKISVWTEAARRILEGSSVIRCIVGQDGRPCQGIAVLLVRSPVRAEKTVLTAR
jgi:hypothetical protein